MKKLLLLFLSVGIIPEAFAGNLMTVREKIYSYASQGNVEKLKDLQKSGYSLDIPDSQGQQAVCEAVAKKDKKAFKTLQEAGANMKVYCPYAEWLTCHLGRKSCFGDFADAPLEWLPLLEEVIESRKRENNPEASYTAKLFQRGLSRMAQKVGEEGLETALAAVTDDPNFIGEASDLIFHLLVLLNAKGFRLMDVSKYLKTRNR